MDLLNSLIQPYKDYQTQHIILELLAIITAVISVCYSFKNKIWVFPFGIISTLIYVYLLWQWNLLGDMVINTYYCIMSIYGWYIWTRKINASQVTPITNTTRHQWLVSLLLFITTTFAIYNLYYWTDRIEQYVSYIDILTTGLFFAGMWLMARRTLQHWLVLMVANIISVPLYFYKGYGISGLLYIFLSIIAYFGYLEWKKYLDNTTIQVND